MGGDEDRAQTFRDFVLDRMVVEALLVQVVCDESEVRLRLDDGVALSLASMRLLRLLPLRNDFAPNVILKNFLLDYYGTDGEEAMLWGCKILENLCGLKLL